MKLEFYLEEFMLISMSLMSENEIILLLNKIYKVLISFEI